MTRHHLAADGGVHAAATVGLSSPAWAAAPDGHFRRESPSGDEYRVGTINIVVAVPVRLSDAALVNAVATATEAKAQALHENGVRATGTASDAVVVHCPTDGTAETYGGPRSTFGARIARAVHAAVLAGARTLDLRASRASLRTVNGLEALAHPGQRLVEDLHLFATPFVGRMGGSASTFGRYAGRTLPSQQAEVLLPRGPQPAL